MNEQLKKRIKSFAWRFGLFMCVCALSWISDNIPTLGLPVVVAGLISYLANEGTKMLNSRK